MHSNHTVIPKQHIPLALLQVLMFISQLTIQATIQK